MNNFKSMQLFYAPPEDMFGFEKRNQQSNMEVNELAAFLEEQVIPHVQKAARLDERIKLCDEAIAKNKAKI